MHAALLKCVMCLWHALLADNISYVYHAMHSFFDRDNINLPGLAAYFDDESKEARCVLRPPFVRTQSLRAVGMQFVRWIVVAALACG